MIEINLSEIEDNALKHIESVIKNEQLMKHFKKSINGAFSMYVKSMITEYHKSLLNQVDVGKIDDAQK